MRHACVALALLLLLATGRARGADPAPGAHAAGASTDADRASALSLVRQGNTLLDRQQPAAALEKFREAHRLVGGDKLRFNLGQALSAIPGHEVEAYREFQQFLDKVPGAAPDVARTARRERDRLRARVAVVRLATVPADAAVEIDGQPLSSMSGPAGRTVVLAPGEHRLVVRAPRFVAFEGSLALAPGQELEKSVRLVPAPASAAPAPIAAAPPPARAHLPPGVAVPPPSPASAPMALAPNIEARAPAAVELDDSGARPVYKRWWFWAAIAGLAGAAAVSAIALSGGDPTRTCPPGITCQPLP